ncbi:hypothetical protein NEOC84_000754|uniref:hypothetical protein n=1 Tax=Neochlamydia sp. AcF84 TaxID=2315858 RepID=UPI001409AFC8|nr:hypothetical protein [Neochlamydia sp. AcF84]NGY94854.1 hypothetical protein [Neochlamydia sp. AcF84]
MKINTQDLFNDINALRLYEVAESVSRENGKKSYTIKRVKLNQHDSIERIEALITKLNEGKIWLKVGKRREGTVKYAGKGLKPSEIASIILKKQDKTDKTQIEISIDITKENLEDQVEEMSHQDISLLERIAKSLQATFKLDIQKKVNSQARIINHPVASSPVKSKHALAAKATMPEEKKVTYRSRSQESKKEKKIEEEKAIEKQRVQKRKALTLAKELDEKSDKRRLRAIKSTEKQKEILKAMPSPRKAS